MGERNTKRKTRTRTENKPLSVKALNLRTGRKKKVGLQSQQKKDQSERKQKEDSGSICYMVPKTSINHFKKKVQYEKGERRVGWKQREEEVYVSSTLHDQAKKKGGG